MALAALSSGVLARRRANSYLENYPLWVREALNAVFKHLSSNKSNPDLVVLPFVANSTTDAVLSDSACTLYAIVAKGGTTARFWRAADHATLADSPTLQFQSDVSEYQVLSFPEGYALATGLTFDESGAAGPAGFVILGAA